MHCTVQQIHKLLARPKHALHAPSNYGFSAYIQVITKKQDNIVSVQLKANLKLVRLPCDIDYREQAIHKRTLMTIIMHCGAFTAGTEKMKGTEAH